MNKFDIFKRIAFENVTKKIESFEDFEKSVCNWWRRKYKMPDTDIRFLNKYIDDIIIEYFEDQFINDNELLYAYSNGFESMEDMEKVRIKELMGDDYTEEISYLIEPSKDENNNEEEIIETFNFD